MKFSITKEAVIWTSCLAFGSALLFIELAAANADDIQPPADSTWADLEAAARLSREQAISPDRNRVLASRLLVEAIVQVESSGKAGKVGSKGERGLMQVMPETWSDTTRRLFGEGVSFDRAFDPVLNRQVGQAYLAWLQHYLCENRKKWNADERSLLLACYNAGPARVRESGFDIENLPASTRDYVQRASALHDYFLQEHQRDLTAVLASQTQLRSSDS